MEGCREGCKQQQRPRPRAALTSLGVGAGRGGSRVQPGGVCGPPRYARRAAGGIYDTNRH